MAAGVTEPWPGLSDDERRALAEFVYAASTMAHDGDVVSWKVECQQPRSLTRYRMTALENTGTERAGAGATLREAVRAFEQALRRGGNE